jgi:hypothetical protein
MRDFDFVKFVLIFTAAATLVAAGGTIWLGTRVSGAQRDLADCKRSLADIGELAGNIDTLQKEKASDQALKHSNMPATYFQEMAWQARIDLNTDCEVSFGDKEEGVGYVDQLFTLSFKSNAWKKREELAKFVFNVETQSPRIKLVKCKILLDAKRAELDLWRATPFVFLRRDPLSTVQ